MKNQNNTKPILVAGVGASAGGLDALKRFFKAITHDSRFAFIVVQHLDPTHKSMMAEILNREGELTFYQAVDQQEIQANCAYIIPPDAYIEVVDHTISIIKPPHQRGSRLAIDHLFRSMAEVYGSKAVGLLFSGSGSDGTAGLRALKAAGGLVIVQDPKSAEYPSMPRSAIDAGVADQVEVVEAIPDLLIRYAQHPYHAYESNEIKSVTSGVLRTITSLLKAQENIDLNQYKEATVERRIYRRMSLLSNTDPGNYIQLLRENDAERQSLIKDLLINVTDFFRDRDAFGILDNEVINTLVDQTESGSDIRVWVAGCASGEEAYTIAMLLFERINKTEKELGIKIFATDVDEEAIKIARRGVYPSSIIFELPEKLQKTYFSIVDDTHFIVNNKLRGAISFAIQNVYTDPPFSKVDLVSCRNVLIYLRRSVQHKVLKSFYFALRQGGYLFLGSSENAGELKGLFKTVSPKWRIYQRSENSRVSLQPAAVPSFFRKDVKRELSRGKKKSADMNEHIRNALVSGLRPSVIIDGNNRVIYFHGKLEPFIQLPDGQADLNFIAMLAPSLRTRIRSGIYKARKIKQRVSVRPPNEFMEQDPDRSLFQAIICPVKSKGFDKYALIVSFEELVVSDTANNALNKEPDTSVDQEKMIDAMESELIETREELQNTVEELETSTEELKASHEESLATNEELQSSNEELEASTEELRSLNEELTTVNMQLKEKISELSVTHDDIKNFFASTNLATIFLSQDLTLKRYTPAAERLLRIGSQDIDRPIYGISRALISEETVEEAKGVLNSLEPAEKEIEADDGRWFVRKILPYQTEDRRIVGVVVTYNEVTRLKSAVNSLQASGMQQAVIAQLGLKALSSDSVSNLMDQMVREIAFTLDADYCHLLEYQAKQNHLLLKAGIGWDKGLVGTTAVPADMSSQAGFTLNSREPVIVKNLATEKRFTGSFLLNGHKVVSGLSCVIATGSVPYGVLGVFTTTKRLFTKDDANFLVSAANILSVAIHRESTEKQLKENENRLRIAKDSNKMGSFEYVIASGETYWDDVIKSIWGLDSDVIVTQDDFYQGLHPEDREEVTALIEDSVSSAEDGHYHARYRVINKKTQELSWVEASGQVLFENGQPLKMIGMVIDITEQKKMEISLQSAVEQQKNANERKNEFLAILGHELRNPLAAMSSGVQVLQEDASKSQWALEMMSNNIKLVSTLLDDLLDLTRISRGQIKLNVKPVDIGALLQEMTDNFAAGITRKKQQLTLSLPEESVVTKADRVRLEQVVSNLINNAHKFTPEGGQISVKLTPPFADKFEMSVQDTGIGIDMKDRNKIFEPFHQLKGPDRETTPGLGIGLSLVKQFVLLHNGGVDVTSKGINKGTEVTVTLPLVIDDEDLADGASEQLLDVDESVDSLMGLRVLIVDDNEDAAQGLAMMLELKGCVVKTRYDGESALTCCLEYKPSVLILDIGLPDINGFDLLRNISAAYSKQFYAIALTGYGHNEAQVNSKDAGFDVHFNKPADLNLLVRTLSSYKRLLKGSLSE